DFVVKPDGLTGGKGVRVLGEHLASIEVAYDYAAGLIAQGGRVVIEERLQGEEFSLQSITDGSAVAHCPPVQDHKRAYEGDNGPNTGGMGSYSDADLSLPFLSGADLQAAQAINEAVVQALEMETGESYRGVLYGGFMATTDGVRLIEYNCRFGDPEAMNVLPLLRTDFVEICWAVAQGRLSELRVDFDAKATVCKYVVPEMYPTGSSHGEEIRVPAALLSDSRVRCYWAAVNAEGPQVMMTGSRALAVVGLGDSLDEAERHAERAASMVEGPLRHRRDIGTRSLVESRVAHMRELRGGQRKDRPA
ncbi:MAG: phosphoribosylamine--glycine ligase, partial [Acidimicrobiales bacterium]